MLVTARCIAEAYDSHNARHYYPGDVSDFDTENETLNGLTTVSGRYVFQYTGHNGSPAVKRPAADTLLTPAAAPKAGMSEAHKKKMAEGRAKKRAALAAKAETQEEAA